MAVLNNKTMNWINVKERLPNKKCELIILNKYLDVCVCFFNGNEFTAKFMGEYIKINAIYWMNIPEPPQQY